MDRKGHLPLGVAVLAAHLVLISSQFQNYPQQQQPSNYWPQYQPVRQYGPKDYIDDPVPKNLKSIASQRSISEIIGSLLTCRSNDSILLEPQEFIYHNYESLTNFLQEYTNKYKDVSRLYSVGKSVEGRDLWVIEISDRPGHHQPGSANTVVMPYG